MIRIRSRVATLVSVVALMIAAAGRLVAQRAEQGPKPVSKAESAMVSSSLPR